MYTTFVYDDVTPIRWRIRCPDGREIGWFDSLELVERNCQRTQQSQKSGVNNGLQIPN